MERNFKRILASILTVVILLTATPLSCFIGLELTDIFSIKAEAATYNGTCGDNLTWTLNTDSGLLEISGTGDMYNWSDTETPWDSYRSSIQTVIIGNGVTTLGDRAFGFCENLTSVTIPDSVTSIGDDAFSFCEKLTNVTIPDSVTTIGSWAFSECLKLTSITIPDSVTSIDDCTFYDCISLKSVLIGDSVTSIGTDAFYYCINLTSVAIPNSVKSIGEGAFNSCITITDVYYDGTEEQWNLISVEPLNDCLLDATIHYEPKVKAKVNSVSIDDISMNYKNSATITPSIDADDGVEYTISYTSSNDSVARVDQNGKVTSTGKGNATITCTVTDELGNTVTDTCNVEVNYSWWQWIIVIVLFGWIWY